MELSTLSEGNNRRVHKFVQHSVFYCRVIMALIIVALIGVVYVGGK